MIKAVFFDFDGVLVISEHLHYQAWKDFLLSKHLSLNGFTLENVIGVSDREIAKKLKKQFSLKESVEELYQIKRKFFSPFIEKKIPHPKGRNAFLKSLKKRGLFLAVVSSCPTEDILNILKKQKLETCFDSVIGAEDSPKQKPDPMPYKIALKNASAKPSEAIAIEDSKWGIKAAQGAKIKILGMKSPYDHMETVKGQIYFSDFMEIRKYFEKHYF